MKRLITMVFVLILLCGCGKQGDSMEQALQLRGKLNGTKSSFDAVITADYGDTIFTFRLHCSYDANGELKFSVLEPETIAGISGRVSASGGKLEFDDVALAFDILADGLISPISGPWVMMNALTGGYITSAGADGEYTRVTIQDSYRNDAMTVDFWLKEDNTPLQADIIWKDRRILTIRVENFIIE